MTKHALLLLLFAAPNALCQTTGDPNTLQTLLSEVRQLRQAIEAMTASSQRVQIALFQLQMQDAAVSRSTLRFDALHDKCADLESHRQKLASDIQKEESEVTASTLPQAQTALIQAGISEEKRQLESKSAEAQNCQAAEAEALSRLRNEQAALSDLQGRIQRLDKDLQKLASGDK